MFSITLQEDFTTKPKETDKIASRKWGENYFIDYSFFAVFLSILHKNAFCDFIKNSNPFLE